MPSFLTSLAGNVAAGAASGAAGAIAIRVVPDTSSFGSMLKTGFSSMLGLAGIGGIAAGLQQVISIGNDFTNTLNTLQAVSSATAEQMSAVRDRAKELGNDLTIPNTSAANAAEAMTELAKGGFSVEQSMEAAKGTLQLAAAAQISAADAAGIQSKALQTFGLDAEYAGKAADVFANAANASNLEMTDVALGLQAGGTVANQFGLSLEDTSAALATFANVGIRGSDAGTLLKSSLLALTDQGKPAKRAIEELGLSLYDAEGQFVGIQPLMQQLADASGRMTEEQYQAATATLFGSDAIRFAGIAADDGVGKYDALRDAMDRQGTAAEVAAAKTQGLPGALQQIQNAVENAALEIYDLIDGPLESLATSAADKIGQATTAITSGLDGMDTSHYVDAFDNLVSAGEKIVSVGKSIGEALSGGGEEAGTMIEFLTRRIENLVSVVAPIATAGAKVLGWVLDLPGPIQAAVIAFGLLHHVLGPIPAVIGLAATGLGRLAATSVGQAIPGLAGVASMARTAAIALTALQAGVAVAAIAITTTIQANAAAEARTDALADAAKRGAAAQRDLAKAFKESNGALSDQAVGAIAQQVQAYQDSLDTMSDNGGWTEKAAASFGVAWDLFKPDASIKEDWDRAWAAFDDAPEDSAQSVKDALDSMGMSADQIAEKLVASDAEWAGFTQSLRGAGEAGDEAANKLQKMRDDIQEAQEVAKNTTDGFYDITEAIRVIADDSSTAADKVNALKTALDVMQGKSIPIADALQDYNRVIRDIADSTREVWDQTKGWGESLIVDGALSTATENGDRLKATLDDLKDKTIQAAASGADMGPIWSQNALEFEHLATATGLSSEQIRGLAEQAGLVPSQIEMLVGLQGADTAEQQLAVVLALLEKNGEGVDIPVDALDAEAREKLDAILDLKEDATKPGVIHISAPTDAAIAEVNALKTELSTIKDRTVTVTTVYADAGGPRQAATQINPATDLGGNADGGRLPMTGPGTGMVDGFVMVDGNGMAIARGDRGEWLINRGSSQRYDRELAEINAGTFPKLPGYETGGRIGDDDAVTRTMAFLRGENGKPYQYGGTGNPSWDCSGFISAAYASLKNLDPYTRWFTTESDFGSLGFQRGLDPTGRGLSIGVHNGGGDQYSHMAGTLAGTNIESGVGVQVGAGAAGAADGQFENKYYLAENLFVPPGGTGTSSSAGRWSNPWDQEDELKLDAARLAVTKAQEEADKALADPKKSQADKDIAQNKVAQAEQKVQELEAEKAAGGSGKRLDDSTDASSSRSSESSVQTVDQVAAGIPELLGNVAKSFVQGQVQDVFDVFGIGGQGAIPQAITQGISYGQKLEQSRQSAPTFSQDEIDKQGPVTPGTPNWLEELTKTFRIPAVLRDQGGPLPHGMAALNLSGETEWVSTARQRANDLAALRNPSGGAASGGGTTTIDARTIVENQSIGMSAGEFRREWGSMQAVTRQRVKSYMGSRR